MMRVFLGLILISSLSCDKSPACLPITDLLSIDVSATGIKDTVQVDSDTIWISMEVPRFYEDTNSDQKLELTENLDRSIFLGTSNLNFLDGVLETTDFEFINDIGEIIIVNQNIPFLTFEYIDDLALIRFGLVPKVRGVYLIDLVTIFSEPYLNYQRTDTNCSQRIFDVIFNLNNRSEDNNYHILGSSPLPEYNSDIYTLDDFNSDGGFAIIVEE